eukprot:3452704-Prymnesium_polylepis.1
MAHPLRLHQLSRHQKGQDPRRGRRGTPDPDPCRPSSSTYAPSWQETPPLGRAGAAASTPAGSSRRASEMTQRGAMAGQVSFAVCAGRLVRFGDFVMSVACEAGWALLDETSRLTILKHCRKFAQPPRFQLHGPRLEHVDHAEDALLRRRRNARRQEDARVDGALRAAARSGQLGASARSLGERVPFATARSNPAA